MPSPVRSMTLAERLAFYSIPEPNTGCLLWTANYRGPYGRLWWQGKSQDAHRLAWEVAHGRPAGESHICHRCDIGGCVNADHLYAGDAIQNEADKRARGRHARGPSLAAAIVRSGKHALNVPRGENVHAAKLNKSQIIAIRGDTREQWQIAADYGVTQPTISKIKARKRWLHI